MPGVILTTEAQLTEAAAALAAREPVFARVLPVLGPLPLRRVDDGFLALRDSIIGQQVSVASARAIRARLDAAGFGDEAAVAAADEGTLRACGLSRQKIRYLSALAEARLDYGALRVLPNEAVVAALVPLPGIGRWTAEMYLMFALGRADVFAPDDLALAEAARMLFALPDRPRPKAFAAMAAPWAPWRAVAARLLWAYYAHTKRREGVG
ncbi:MAG: DNA-3-methyladenine glycosylase 2 family protein [Rhodobacteraceae bacterium]|nr:DNA-3-methyladenine glycosylase 2 family protein [Paracoccaceae bacterium]